MDRLNLACRASQFVLSTKLKLRPDSPIFGVNNVWSKNWRFEKVELNVNKLLIVDAVTPGCQMVFCTLKLLASLQSRQSHNLTQNQSWQNFMEHFLSSDKKQSRIVFFKILSKPWFTKSTRMGRLVRLGVPDIRVQTLPGAN